MTAWTLFFAFAALVVVSLLQGALRRRRNPLQEVDWSQLPPALRAELERVLPGFVPRSARLTRRGDEARVEAERDGERVRAKAELEASGELVELDIDTPGHLRETGTARLEELPGAVRDELDRLLGDARAAFEPWQIRSGRTGEGEPGYELKGRAGDWKWEIELSASGRLIELEREKKRGRR